MGRLGEMRRRIAALVRGRQADRDLDDEMALHFELMVERERAAGATQAEALALAHRRFGSRARVRESAREARGWRWLADLSQDARYAVRLLSKQPGFTAASVLTLALGVGATTAIFSVVDGIVLRPLPFPAADRLVQIYGTPALRGEAVDNFEVYQSESTSFEGMTSYTVSARFMTGPAGPERVTSVAADRNFLEVIGVAPAAGRAFAPGDPANVALVSDAFWREHLGGSASVVGMQVMLDRAPFTIIGVMPSGFQFPYAAASGLTGVAADTRTDAWIPWDRPLPRGRADRVTARLKPDVTIEQAASELDVISARIQAERPDPNGARGVRVVPLEDSVVTSAVKRPLFLLLGAVAMVLALACANVANLSLVRMSVRAREIAVRRALGAAPWRVARQLFTESAVLAAAGGAAGFLLAAWGTRELTRIATAALPRTREVHVDWRIFLFALAMSGATAILVGMAPAVAAARTRGQAALQEAGARATMGRGMRALRNALVIVEVALACALASGAGLLIRELARLGRVETGMSTDRVLTLHLGERPSWWGTNRRGAPPAEDVRVFYAIAREVAAVPGVRAAGFTQMLPLQNWGWTANTIDFRVPGGIVPPPPPFPMELRYVTPGYFAALGIPVRRGRVFTEGDTADAPPAIVINETLARRLAGDRDPVGATTPRGTIVGVVADVRQVHLDRPAAPELYYPIAQNYSELIDLGMTLLVRTDGDPLQSVGAIRAAIRRVTTSQAIFDVKTMDDVLRESLAGFTLYLRLIIGFAIVALALAGIGTYGVMSYIGASRAREFALRVALGASRGAVTALVFRDGARMVAAGLALGIAAALIAAPLLRSLPITVRPPDAVTMGLVALLVAASALSACIAPAMRAASSDPMRALREE
jgi:predicted permease